MRAILLGTGAPPPNPGRRGPATLVALGEERFLVDAGSGVGAQLVQAGIRPYDWPRVLIAHHHSDHTMWTMIPCVLPSASASTAAAGASWSRAIRGPRRT
jgi:ribonuclease Z